MIKQFKNLVKRVLNTTDISKPFQNKAIRGIIATQKRKSLMKIRTF